MAATQNFTVGPAWVRIASGRHEGQLVKVEGSGPFYICTTVGVATMPPELAPLRGHPVSGVIDLPLVGQQHLWASAQTSTQMTVT